MATFKLKHKFIESKNPPLKSLKGLVTLYHQVYLKEAIAFKKTLTELYPRDSKIWNIMGAAATQLGEHERPFFAFQKMLFLDPNDSYAKKALVTPVINKANLMKQ